MLPLIMFLGQDHRDVPWVQPVVGILTLTQQVRALTMKTGVARRKKGLPTELAYTTALSIELDE